VLSADSLLICCFGEAFPSPHLNRSLFTTPFPSSQGKRMERGKATGLWVNVSVLDGGGDGFESCCFSLFQINTACIPAQPSELVRLSFVLSLFPSFYLIIYHPCSFFLPFIPLTGSLIIYFLVHHLLEVKMTFLLSFVLQACKSLLCSPRLNWFDQKYTKIIITIWNSFSF